MLNRFSSYTKKLNRVVSKININNLNDSLYITASLENIELPTTSSFQSNTRKNPYLPKVVNENNLNDSLFITASLINIELPSSRSFDATTKSNPNNISIVNNKNKIEDFYIEILQYSARSVQRKIDSFDIVNNTMTIDNVKLGYGTEQPSPYNFEIFVFGLKIPSDYTIKEVGDNNVVITLLDSYVDFENTDVNDIYVIGKLVNVQITTEEFGDLITEDDNFDIIL